tara:strand:- start:71 stop:235 length:165 start_codon:yes stop_codon:yes gene_type:complete
MREIFRGLDYHRFRIALIIGTLGVLMVFFAQCSSKEYNDVQMREFKSDTTKTEK